MIAYEAKIDIFEEMRYFLMFYLNLGLIVRLAFSSFDFIQLQFFFQLDVVFPELSFSFYAFNGNFYHHQVRE